MNLGRRITRAEAGLALQALAGVAFGLGAFMLLGARPAAAVLGFPQRRSSRTLLRLTALRDLALGAILLSALRGRSRDTKRTAVALVVAGQVADVTAAGLLFARGRVGFRGLATVAAGALPTMLAALAVFDNYRTE